MTEFNSSALVQGTISAHQRTGQSPEAESANEIVFTGSCGFCRQGIDSSTGSPGVDRRGRLPSYVQIPGSSMPMTALREVDDEPAEPDR